MKPKEEMTEIVLAIDEISGEEAIYVDGILFCAGFSSDGLMDAIDGEPCLIKQIVVYMPSQTYWPTSVASLESYQCRCKRVGTQGDESCGKS